MTRTSANRARARRIARHCVRAKGSAAAPAAAKASFPCGAHAQVPGAALPRPEKRLELSVDPAYPMCRQHVPEFLCARPRPAQPLAAE